MKVLLTAVIIATTLATTGFANDYPEPPQSAIKMLLADPTSAGGFDLTFGEGKAKEVLDKICENPKSLDAQFANCPLSKKTLERRQTNAEKREDEASKRIQTANEVIPKGKFMSTVANDGFVIVYKGKVYQCRAYKANEIGCEQNPDK
tara:strand:- start:64 stop:507 length:444 start_codon:yes stop_codon:yes gene_type:complete